MQAEPLSPQSRYCLTSLLSQLGCLVGLVTATKYPGSIPRARPERQQHHPTPPRIGERRLPVSMIQDGQHSSETCVSASQAGERRLHVSIIRDGQQSIINLCKGVAGRGAAAACVRCPERPALPEERAAQLRAAPPALRPWQPHASLPAQLPGRHAGQVPCLGTALVPNNAIGTHSAVLPVIWQIYKILKAALFPGGVWLYTVRLCCVAQGVALSACTLLCQSCQAV